MFAWSRAGSIPPRGLSMFTSHCRKAQNYYWMATCAARFSARRKAHCSYSHARSILFLLGALALAGAVASFSLPVALFPQVSFPRVRITLDAGDRPAEQMTIEVTTPVEEAVRAIPGVRNLRSTTSRGSAE